MVRDVHNDHVAYRHVYVHVPFCARRCSYCDFSIAVRRQVPVREYVRGITAELRARGLRASSGGIEVESLYCGGGTPSQLGGDGIHQLFDTLREVFTPVSGAELTIEVNPEDVTPEHARAWAHAGVNRVSLGVQSFNDRVLSWMHRVHNADAARVAVSTLRDAGIADVSVDLIFAVPSELERDWHSDVAQALALEPTHISLYGLTVEPGTPLGKWTQRGQTAEAPETAYEAEFLHASSALSAAGFEHYEVSNYRLPGFNARHNSAYWRNVPYLGLGPAAHGFDGQCRRWNESAYARWQTLVDGAQDPVGGSEVLTPANREAEAVYLGLRTQSGLTLHDSERPVVAAWQAAGWVTLSDDGVLRCTPLGWLRLDALAAALTIHRSP